MPVCVPSWLTTRTKSQYIVQIWKKIVHRWRYTRSTALMSTVEDISYTGKCTGAVNALT